MSERMRLSTGFVRAAGYANKLRRTLIALTKGIIEPAEAARKAAVINMRLFDVFREKGIDKGDVVRIIFEFDIVDKDGKKDIQVDWNTMSIEVYKNAGVITGITPPEEVAAEAQTAVVGEWREFEYDDEIFKKLKLKAEEIIKTDTGYTLRASDFEAEVIDKEKIRIKYTGPPEKVNEFYVEVLSSE
ncbi:MAG: single- stranded DNA-binding family protein [Candidatus Njordarchaeales archaeon]